MALAAAGLAAALDAVLVEPQMLLSVTRVDLPAGHGGRLSGRLRETRVVHLTDLHVRGLGARERRLMRRLEEIEPDLILMTGDYAEGPDGPAALAELLGAVRPALGTWAALGNNDHYRGQRQSVLEALEKAGAVVLRNRHVVLEAPGGPVAIAAVDDPHYDWDDSEAALAGLAEDVPVVLLAHSADLLLPGRGYGLLVNAADERGAWKRGWFWQDGAHMRPDLGEVTFPSTGRRRLRVQRREDGVGVSEIRLVPATGPARRRGFRGMPEPEPVEGQIVVRMESIADEDIHGDWSRLETEKGMALVDGPDRGITQ
ncbi:MAG TPA: metallophosphoesterase, partial [Candidatus Polarisedimenticolia bacterium]|nr:metallophosphoesterase [Candidatus Polarisedimenticolia bacterium]